MNPSPGSLRVASIPNFVPIAISVVALDEFDGFFAEVTGEAEFIEAVGQRCGGGEGEHGVAMAKRKSGCPKFCEQPTHLAWGVRKRSV